MSWGQGTGSELPWKFFERVADENMVECRLCPKRLRYGGSTANMLNHLEANHKAALGRSTESTRATSLERSTRQAAEIKPCVDVNKPSTSASNGAACNASAMDVAAESANPVEKQTRMSEAIVTYMIIGCLQPISNVTSTAFRDLASVLDPTNRPPSEAELRQLVDQKYEASMNAVSSSLRRLNTLPIVAFETWKNWQDEYFLNLSVIYINDHWKQESSILCCHRLGHTLYLPPDVEQAIATAASKYHLPRSLFAVADDRVSIVAAVKKSEYIGAQFSCFGHMIKYCMQFALGYEPVAQAIDRLRTLCFFFRQNAYARSQLKFEQEKHITSATWSTRRVSRSMQIYTDENNRWISTHAMLERALLLQFFLQLCIQDARVQHDMRSHKIAALRDEDWLLLRKVTKVIKEAANGLKVSEDGQQYVPASVCYPVRQALLKKCETSENEVGAFSEFKRRLSKAIKVALDIGSEEMPRKIALACSYVDPRFKQVEFLNAVQKAQLRETVAKLSEVISFSTKSLAPAVANGASTSTGERSNADTSNASKQARKPKAKANESTVEQLRRKFQVTSTSNSNSSDADILLEMTRYEAEPVMERNGDPLAYWKSVSESGRFQKLCAVAQHLLAIPATCCPSPQMFSPRRHRLKELRSPLGARETEKMVVLHGRRGDKETRSLSDSEMEDYMGVYSTK